jgi:hypothetical protein
MDIEINHTMNFQEDPGGDFLERCLPKSFSYYISKSDRYQYTHPQYDEFDLFIMREVPCLKYVISYYYKNHRAEQLKLVNIADKNMIANIDEAILHYLETQGKQFYFQVKELYILMIEQKMLKLLNDLK